MIILIIFNVYLSIGVVSLYDYSGVLSMCLNGGEKSGVDYLSHWIIQSEYYDINDSNNR